MPNDNQEFSNLNLDQSTQLLASAMDIINNTRINMVALKEKNKHLLDFTHRTTNQHVDTIPSSSSEVFDLSAVTDWAEVGQRWLAMNEDLSNESGTAKTYLNRNQALKHLQVSLKGFRRMCILKGIYPRDPKHKSKLAQGSSAAGKTYYHVKDIKHLASDPILSTLRECKIFTKKIRRLHARGEWELAKRFKTLHKPKIPFPEIIKSRYPSFIDALNDLDDALSHLALFAAIPSTAISTYNPDMIKSCYRLLCEFSRYVMETHSLRHVFISVKGTYLQAEVHGQTITWLVPHAFTLEIPLDVDKKVMVTFLELYSSLVSFINFRLLKEINWGYPSIIMDGDVANNPKKVSTGIMAVSNPAMLDSSILATNSILASSTANLGNIETSELLDQFEVQGNDVVKDKLADSSLIEDTDGSIVSSIIQKNDEKKVFESLFSNVVFFLSREVPFDILVICIMSFGGRVGWNHGPGSPFSEDDTRITHHVIDRPVLLNMFGGRKYIQPQWIFDSINSRKLLSEDLYGPTVKSLPPHLSPFVHESDDIDQENEDTSHSAPSIEPQANQDVDQTRELALSMMSKKKRKLYEAMQRGIRNKNIEKNRLASRRRQKTKTSSKSD